MYDIKDLLIIPSNLSITQMIGKKRPATDVTGRFDGY